MPASLCVADEPLRRRSVVKRTNFSVVSSCNSLPTGDARWIYLGMLLAGEDYCCLALRGMGGEWEAWEAPPPHVMHEACFETLPRRSILEHQVLRARRDGEAYINVHRFLLPGSAGSAELNEFLTSLALEKESESSGCNRSNVGGWHSSDDLWQWKEMTGEQGCRVAGIVRSAVHQVEEYENDLHKRHAACEMGLAADTSSLKVDDQTVAAQRMPTREAWLNVSRAGNWNHFHTHPGSTLSGCYYVSSDALAGASTCTAQCGADLLQGRLVLLTSAPDDVSDHSLHLVHRFHEGTRPPETQPAALLLPAAEGPSKCVLHVDPVPGSLVVFPSFVPHLVLPLGVEFAGCTACRSSDASGGGAGGGEGGAGGGGGGAQGTPAIAATPRERDVRISLAFNHVATTPTTGAP